MLRTKAIHGKCSLRNSDFFEPDRSARKLTVEGNDLSSYRIVYDDDLYYSKARAMDLQALFEKLYGVMLAVDPDTTVETEHEILVGETNRAESVSAVAEFDRPNYHWSVKIVGKKIVVANQGYRTGEAALAAIRAWFGAVDAVECNLTVENFSLSGNVGSTDASALPRPAGTDVRVLQTNVMGTTLATQQKAEGYTEQMCCELFADTYLLYYPDVIAFNEMTPTSGMKPGIMQLLRKYYTFIDAEWLGIVDDGKAANAKRTYNVPIAYRKDAGLTVIDSGFTYLSDLINYHGTLWAVFETENGYRFLVASNHLSKNVVKNEEGKEVQSPVYSEDVLKAVQVARDRYGDLPVVLCGDWFFGQSYYATAYRYMIGHGLVDVSETAAEKHSVGIGTYHDIGVEQTGRVEEDLLFVNPEWFSALSHKIIVDFCTNYSSDHYPVFADLRFVKPATTAVVHGAGPLVLKPAKESLRMDFSEFLFE